MLTVDILYRVYKKWDFTGRIKYVRNEDNNVNMYLEVKYKAFFGYQTEWLPEHMFSIREETIVNCKDAL